MSLGSRIPSAAVTVALAAAMVGLSPATPAARADTSAATPSILAVFAHQDDDVLFFNPDIRKIYNLPLVSVYVTSGGATDEVGSGLPFPDTCSYALSRDQGARAAHARIAGVTNPTWTVNSITVAGKVMEEDTLDQAPQVKLVFMKLHEAGDANFVSGVNNQAQLQDLYDFGTQDNTHEATMGTIAADGGSHCQSAYANQTYTHADLVNVLTALMARYAPTVVLGMDPNVGYDFSFHPDHIATAEFLGDASTGYHGPGGSGHFLLRDYRDYTIDVDPADVDSVNGTAKQGDFLAYLGPNRNTSSTYSGQFDPGPNPNDTFYSPMYTREHPRWSPGAQWVTLDGAGLLNAFAVLDGKVVSWRENTPGGTWTGPVTVPGGSGLTPTLSAVKDGNGQVRLFGTRMSDWQVVTAAQTAPGTWGPWTVLGNPNPAGPQQVGNPATAAGQDGRVTVFVRNGGGGVSAMTQNPDGSWPASWADLGGTLVRDDVAAGVGCGGHMELFAPSINGILHWKQNAAGAFVRDSTVLGPATASQITTARNADGRLQIFFFQPNSAQVATQYTQTNGTWTKTPFVLSSPPGLESVAAVTGGDGRISLFARNSGGGVSTASQVGVNNAFSTAWSDLGNTIVGPPAVVADSAGRLVVLALEPDAALHVARQTSPGTNSAFGAWQLAGT